MPPLYDERPTTYWSSIRFRDLLQGRLPHSSRQCATGYVLKTKYRTSVRETYQISMQLLFSSMCVRDPIHKATQPSEWKPP